MKLRPRDAEAFCANPGDCPAILIYGPDSGLVRERARTVIASVLGAPPDRDRLAELTAADLKADPARLRDELTAISMFPGRRVVHLRDGAEPKLMADVLDDLECGALQAEALLLVEAGDLPPRAPLRKSFEAAKTAAAAPCYGDDARGLSRLIRDALAAHGLKVDPDALSLLSETLGGDRGVTRQEIEKLALYKSGGDSTVTVEDVEACLVAPGDAAASTLTDAMACGDVPLTDALIGRAYAAGAAPVGLLRQVSGHLQRLHQTVCLLEIGGDPVAIFNRTGFPRLHFSREDALRRQARIWPRIDLERALIALGEAERQCKTTGLPDKAICHRILLSLANRAARAGR